ncbi:hypothetical protein G3N56_12725 [Desulfovibrio sulfodismutans]|uniref:Putative Flp pilus-assembly TadG-like N-terminal domain-containing protein n=1 Tax=Desulfolutivibrio sulfodismutans TaxID=63561 RepID=A0A7K3NN26_9BACT|nr:pilus assembly protein TadG-related protein [Desulfolutivibrio sulfodismutans]NDY57596.1 hypothetical protein [Desulfolutivibrio sulfodismutans]
MPCRRLEAGSASLMVALSLVLLAGFSALAVDYTYLHHRKAALQRAAEAGALMGAAMLVRGGQNIDAARDATVQAAQKALRREDFPDLAVRDSDVAFLWDVAQDTAGPDQIQVTTGRTEARGNPVNLFLGGLLGQSSADVSASARAEVFCSDASGDLALLVLPAGFTWDDACEPDARFRGNGVFDTQSGCEAASIRVSGYGEQDVGRRLVLSPGRFGEMSPGGMFPVARKALGASGASLASQARIGEGYFVTVGEWVAVDEEPNATGSLFDQARLRLAADPEAYWDEACRAVQGGRHQIQEESPRIVRMSFFDPSQPPAPGRPEVRICQLGAVFIEELFENGGVAVRLTRAMAVAPQRDASACDPRGVGLYGVRLAPGGLDGVDD